ncbi:MAG: saccharopine dehydrogenase NADP-binding domain-containing protein [Rhizobiaceae bacterium]|nr:saccharopine dehydrogenase NADP-binding domain-containing protein [Rhizobiaceae bacterium]
MQPGQVRRIAIFGAGRVGLSLAGLLAGSGDYEVTLADCTEEALAAAAAAGHATLYVDISRAEQVGRLLALSDVAVAAAPDRLVPHVAAAAASAGTHYLDFSEVSAQTRAAGANAPAERAFLAGCGISPGLVDAVAHELVSRLEPGWDLEIRVGAIPAHKTNRLGYGLIWNLEGLLAEYTLPCAAMQNGLAVTLPPLSRREDFLFEGTPFEAFLTAGSVASLMELIGPDARNLVYKTIRHPGHLDYMQLLLDDLGLRSRPDLLATVLRNGLPAGGGEVVLIDVRASGQRAGRSVEEQFSRRIRLRTGHEERGALAQASAAHAATLIDLIRAGALQEQSLRVPALVAPSEVLGSRFFHAMFE